MIPYSNSRCLSYSMSIGHRFIAFFAVVVPMVVFGCGDGTSTFPNLTGDVLIEGRVRDSSGFGIPGVIVAASGVREAGVTDPAGRYQVAVPGGWSGTIRPEKQDFVFSPTEKQMDAAGQNGVDFLATMAKLACCSLINALPMRNPLRPARSMMRPAESPSGLRKMQPALWPDIAGWVCCL